MTWSRYYTFATIRHPVELAISLFRFAKGEFEKFVAKGRAPSPQTLDKLRLACVTGDWSALGDEWPMYWNPVRAYVETLFTTAPPFETFLACSHLAQDSSLRSQYERLSDDSGNLLVDDVLKLEEIETQWPAICQKIGVPYAPLERANASTAEAPEVTPAAEAIIRSRLALDFTHFYQE